MSKVRQCRRSDRWPRLDHRARTQVSEPRHASTASGGSRLSRFPKRSPRLDSQRTSRRGRASRSRPRRGSGSCSCRLAIPECLKVALDVVVNFTLVSFTSPITISGRASNRHLGISTAVDGVAIYPVPADAKKDAGDFNLPIHKGCFWAAARSRATGRIRMLSSASWR
jgi:hypothetical protein